MRYFYHLIHLEQNHEKFYTFRKVRKNISDFDEKFFSVVTFTFHLSRTFLRKNFWKKSKFYKTSISKFLHFGLEFSGREIGTVFRVSKEIFWISRKFPGWTQSLRIGFSRESSHILRELIPFCKIWRRLGMTPATHWTDEKFTGAYHEVYGRKIELCPVISTSNLPWEPQHNKHFFLNEGKAMGLSRNIFGTFHCFLFENDQCLFEAMPTKPEKFQNILDEGKRRKRFGLRKKQKKNSRFFLETP